MTRKLAKDTLEQALALLGGIRDRAPEAHSISLVVCGGSALIATGLVTRTTKDVDVLEWLDDTGAIAEISTLPQWLVEASGRVAELLNLPADWLNPGPRSLVNPRLKDKGLPGGLVDRLVRQDYGNRLVVHFISRLDQIHLKIPAAVDQGGPSRHLDDLLTLSPSAEEIEAACRWAMTAIDPSPPFAETLRQMLSSIGFANVASRL